MFINDNRAIIDLEDIRAVNKIDEKRIYNNDREDFDPLYFLTITYTDNTESILIPYNGDKDGRDIMFNRLQKILVRK